jgi:hypothetical protein
MRRLIQALPLLAAGCVDHDPGPEPPPPPPDFVDPVCSWEASAAGTSGWGDQASDVEFTPEGGVVVAGSVRDDEGDDMWLARYSASGELEWSTRENGIAYRPSIHDLAVDGSGRIGVTGYHDDVTMYDFWVAEYEASGEVAWSVELNNGGGGFGACFSPDGSLYVTGDARDPESRVGMVIFVGKFAPGGELLWSRTASGRHGWNHRGVAIVCDDAGGAVALGELVTPGAPDSLGPATHSWVRRYDPAGAELWTTEIGEEFETAWPDQLLLDPDGDGLLVAAEGRFHRLGLADGAITEQFDREPRHVYAADAAGYYVDGGFSVKVDPECDNSYDDCGFQLYWGYAYIGWDSEPIWWRARASAVLNESDGGIGAVATRDDALVVAGMAANDLWVCAD